MYLQFLFGSFIILNAKNTKNSTISESMTATAVTTSPCQSFRVWSSLSAGHVVQEHSAACRCLLAWHLIS